jgi:ABC-2 type transport system ATP-binding protein
MISVRNLSKSFGATAAVNDISFEVPRGEILGFLGPNGAGKTTTMRIVTCFLPADRGEVSVAGHDVLADSFAVRRCLGYLPENNPLYLDLEVREYLRFVAEIRRLPRAGIGRRVNEMVDVCGLGSERGKLIGELSRGYRQRVGLAQTLIHDPEILVLDEPTVGLDPNQIVEIRELIKRIGEEKTVLLSSHILPEVEATCQRVLIIHEGRIVGQGTPAELAAEARGGGIVHLEVRGPLDAVKETLQGVAGVERCDAGEGDERGVVRCRVSCVPGADAREPLAAAVAGKGWGLLELHLERVTLEEVFHALTGGEQKQ